MSASSSARHQAYDDELLAEELTHVPKDRDGIEYVERARAAGAEGELRYLGAGGQGYVFADARGHAFKVARFDTKSSYRLLSEEYHWLVDAHRVPELRRVIAKVYAYYPALGVLEREEIVGEPVRWGDGGRIVQIHEKLAEALKDRWTAPEFKEDSYVRTSSGPVLVDAGFALRRGEPLVNQALAKLKGEDVGESAEDLAFAVRMESGRTIDPTTADALAAKLEQLPHEERRPNPIQQMSPFETLLAFARRLPPASFGPAHDSPTRGRWTVAATVPIGLLGEITTKPLSHMRRGLSAEQRLDLLRASPTFKPIELEVMPSGMYLIDGNHRLHVARERRDADILVQFFFPERPRAEAPSASHRVVHASSGKAARKDNPTTIGNELILWHGGRPWQGPVEVQGGPIRSNQHGPGVYLTTSATTARKYAKGGGRIFRFVLDPNLVLLDKQRLPVAEMVRWLRDQPRMRNREKVIHDLHRIAAERSTTELPVYMLLNLLVNHDAHGGAHGIAIARWMSSLGIDAELVSPPGKSGEDWLVLFNTDKVLSVRPARPDEVVDTPRVRR